MSSDDFDEIGTFGPHRHVFVCWECGEKVDDVPARSRLENVPAFILGMLVFAITITPLVWLVRVTWGWALG